MLQLKLILTNIKIYKKFANKEKSTGIKQRLSSINLAKITFHPI